MHADSTAQIPATTFPALHAGHCYASSVFDIGTCVLEGKESTIRKGFKRGLYKKDAISPPAPWDRD
jgi:hypothetical protein